MTYYTDPDNNTLRSAIERNDTWKVEHLIKNGTNVNKRYNDFDNQLYKQTFLHLAVRLNYYRNDMITLLIDNGAQINAQEGVGKSPLHLAVDRGNIEIAKILLEKGIDIELKDGYGYTALHIAAYKDKRTLATLLINRGAKVNAEDKFGRTPVHLAAYYGSFGVFKALVENGGDLLKRDKEHLTPLEWAKKLNINPLKINQRRKIIQFILKQTGQGWLSIFRPQGKEGALSVKESHDDGKLSIE
jgi:ankyrin repeat protein